MLLSYLRREPIFLTFKLDFPCINNQSKYEALILGLHTADVIGINKTLAQALWNRFQNVTFEHNPRSANMCVHTLATLASKINISIDNQSITMLVIKTTPQIFIF